uniref:Endoplasmic reticulum junction formation protein lunapark n=1 Tax=Gouania willdenowi TaxID=441366 RepID=A0A8C5N8N6_GOUWI
VHKLHSTSINQIIVVEITDVQILNEYNQKYQRQLKQWVGRLLMHSSLLYLITFMVVYFWFLPKQPMGRFIISLFFIIFPFLVWAIRKLLIIIFTRRIEKNNEKLEDLKARKRKILEEVMETETYRNAKIILERFDPNSKRTTEIESTPIRPHLTPKPGQELRQRNVNSQIPPAMMSPASAAAAAARPPLASGPTYPGRSSHSAPGGPPERSLSAIAAQQSLIRKPVTSGTPVPGVGMHPPGPHLSRPVLPRERGAFDRVLEYLVGAGPQNRYALVCQQCLSHNGMALKEEFEYIAFRCAYCYFLNPARKTRPQAPRLPEATREPRPTMEPVLLSSGAAEPEDNHVPSGEKKKKKKTSQAETPEQGTPTSAEPGSASINQNTPESQEVPVEKSDTEHDVSAMEVE